MATGYTHCINEGASFKEFALKCACAFFYDSTTLQETKINTYYKEKVEASKKELEKAERMTLKEAETQATNEYEDKKIAILKGIQDDQELKKKYDLMLQKTKNWQTPSSEHENMKKFMIEQIETSIEHDCSGYWEDRPEPVQKTPETWLELHIHGIKSSITSYTEHYNDEVDRTTNNNNWIKLLKESLEEED